MEENIRLCNHCYNTTSHQLIVDGNVEKITHEKKIDGKTEGISKPFTYFFVKCETCGEYSLLGCFNDQLENPKLADIPVLFPKSALLDSSVPPKIRRVYEEAAQIINKIPNAYATQIRRALEYLCEDKKAKGNNLHNRLNSLVETGIIPSTLNEMTTVIRLLGNIGSHGDDDEVSLSDAKDIDDFFQFIVEYVYVAPAKLKQVRFNLDWRQLISEHGDLVYKIGDVLMDIGPTTALELDYYDDEDSHLPYEYEVKTVLIVKKLKELNSKAELIDFVYKEYFSFSHPVQEDEFINSVWNIWNEYKK